MKRIIIPAVLVFLILGVIGMVALYLANIPRSSHDASEFYLAICSTTKTGLCSESLPMRRGMSLFVGPPIVTGNDLSASPSIDQSGRPAINLQVSEAGSVALMEATGANLNGIMGVIYLGEIVSHAYIQSQIGGRAQVSGEFTQDELTELMSYINGRSE